VFLEELEKNMNSQNYENTIRISLKKRYAKETRLKFYGIISISFALSFLAIFLYTIFISGYTALQQSQTLISVQLPSEKISNEDGKLDIIKSRKFNWSGLVKKSFRTSFPEVNNQNDKRNLNSLISENAGYQLRLKVENGTIKIGSKVDVWIKTSDDVDMLMKGHMDRNVAEKNRRLSDQQIEWVDKLNENGKLDLFFNSTFFTKADSREPESSGILGATVGSAFALFITLLLALPLAVMSAVYLEYFAKPGKITDFIEVNINNLAAVPSIVFGLLGLAVFLGFFGMPRSVPLVGGMVLALMTLPTIIIATRASIRAVPSSIRDAALGLGASKMQAATDHVLPLAAPGILTGTIIGMAQALGETAPLLMIGMVAFIVDVPNTITSPATALPVQIFMWSDSAERAFSERASLAIMVLLVFLISMNIAAVFLRKKYETKW
jgi:phosphate transport system permease protein